MQRSEGWELQAERMTHAKALRLEWPWVVRNKKPRMTGEEWASWEPAVRRMVWGGQGSVAFQGLWRPWEAIGRFTKGIKKTWLHLTTITLCCGKLAVEETNIDARNLIGGCCSSTDAEGLDCTGWWPWTMMVALEKERSDDSGHILVISSCQCIGWGKREKEMHQEWLLCFWLVLLGRCWCLLQ